MHAKQVHAAHYGAAQYATLFQVSQGNVEPLLAEINVDGSLGFQSIIVVRAESGVRALEDLRGKTLAFPDPNSTSGYLLPAYYLEQAGYMAPGFFAKTGFAGNHENAVLAVLAGTYEAAATYRLTEQLTLPSRMEEKGMIPKNAVRIIWHSPLFTNGPFAVRKDLPSGLKVELAQAMLRMPEPVLKGIGAGRWAGFRQVTHEDYREFLTILEANQRARRTR
jgi:phosphonate transport system substrate-binding protein